MTERPLLYIDVDGPLNPWAAKPHRRPEGYITRRWETESWVARWRAEHPPMRRVKALLVWLNPAHGPALNALADRYDLTWATTWLHEANEYIAPEIGLPQLPVVALKQPAGDHGPGGTYWKTAQLIEHADGRAFAWIDDEIGDVDREYVAEHHPAPALLRHVDPRIGLAGADFEALADWAAVPARSR